MGIHNPMHYPSTLEVRQVNNKYVTLTLWEDTVRQLAKLPIREDDRLQVQQALEVFRLQELADGTRTVGAEWLGAHEAEIQADHIQGCPASTTFSGQRQLFFPIGDNYKLYECLTLG